jgi:hypothetical protein
MIVTGRIASWNHQNRWYQLDNLHFYSWQKERDCLKKGSLEFPYQS